MDGQPYTFEVAINWLLNLEAAKEVGFMRGTRMFAEPC